MAQPRETVAKETVEYKDKHGRSWPAPNPMDTMAMERKYCPFDKRRLSYALHGGEENVRLKEKFMTEFARDSRFRLDDLHELSLDQLRERTMAKVHSLLHFVTTEPLPEFQKRMELVGTLDPGFSTRLGVHYALFLGAIRSGATANQLSYWMDKGVLSMGTIGCFCMTELQHGSNVAGLETTATFDEQTDEFIIHTPSVSATKWWIGGAAHSATHGAVFAQLWVKGKCHGVKTFIVPLRDPKTYHTLSGITIGDLGSKMGRSGIDNGWVAFTYVRVPRAYMLQKHTQVTRDGTVYDPPLQQLTYGALLGGRVSMVADSANIAKKALTIALRYGVVRRQFKTGKNPMESQILDYPLHQRRLLPLMAQAIAMGFTALRMTALYEDLTERLESFDSSSSKQEQEEVLEKLKETHATSAGLKAFCTWGALNTIDICRQSCGGHGYSSYVNLASMYADQAVQCSWEGDNTILTLQSGRSLISSYLEAKEGKKLADGVNYLNDLPKSLNVKCPSDEAAANMDVMDEAWKCVAANVVQKAAVDFQKHVKAGQHKEVAFELCSQERFIAAKIHATGHIYRSFSSALQELAKTEDPSNGVVDILTKICQLYGVWSIDENAAFFLKYHYYTPKQMDITSAKVAELCAEVRKPTMSIVDAFCFTDHLINSPLGRADGNVYKAYFELVRARNPPTGGRPSYFEKLIKPLLEREPMAFNDADSIELDDEIAEIAEMIEERKGQSSNGRNGDGAIGEEEPKPKVDK